MPPILPILRVKAPTKKILRSLRSLLKNWFGPIPTVNNVFSMLAAICRAKPRMALAGAQVNFSTSSGV
ncbi:hypothetical protein THIOM_002097 [Candidatus Thiomargarita nelsonii]|uniref:Uncharacterized protein n=1 Tax=Candidatus Thiomargarita nelsonii TaxID=1003181 RepID=A0A176S235_9GAMM|nr:hypothetical protein THIOM_002097 [Candidatus Thiomargarita nelsonii]